MTGAAPRDEAAEAFANRLHKMARHYEKWARKAGISCYRVYDADLPDYAVAIDLYAGAGPDEGRRWVHVAEYAPPRGVDPGRAERRLDDVVAIVPEVLGVDAGDVFLKTRQRQRGSSQYERVARSGVVGIVGEGGLLFELNFSDYLDTGLFLDHRLTRAWLAELASGARFLNLFAYTGTATVYAASGGAEETTTVDLSATYSSWAERNLERNGFGGPKHRGVKADVLQWIDAASRNDAERFDLIFCDPPTFSNSKRMRETWDVQRDHVSLLTRTAELLAPQGTLVFSCNRRKFELDTAALAEAGLTCVNVTARTIPKDFERRVGVHTCWTIRRSED
jgi:23S rRNA (guanine2445-N2)-methyltransferase / 23S rRNA (guanine2069-N7)-methyltransferase